MISNCNIRPTFLNFKGEELVLSDNLMLENWEYLKEFPDAEIKKPRLSFSFMMSDLDLDEYHNLFGINKIKLRVVHDQMKELNPKEYLAIVKLIRKKISNGVSVSIYLEFDVKDFKPLVTDKI